MTSVQRVCSECGTPLSGDSRQKTCSPAHRVARSRRLGRERKRAEARMGPAANSAAESVRAILAGKTEDAIRDAFIEELRPVVREAIDEDAVRAIQGMVGLAPAAILVLEQDLQSEDAVLRQRAAALVVKYTLGNPAAVPPRDGGGSGLTIINQLPDAPDSAVRTALPETGDLPSQATPVIEATADELRRCESCELDKPEGEFIADAPVCNLCVEQRKARVFEANGLSSTGAVREPSPATDVQRESGAGRPQVRQTGPGFQPGLVRPAGMDSDRKTNQASTPAFGGPPDPWRFSNGS